VFLKHPLTLMVVDIAMRRLVKFHDKKYNDLRKDDRDLHDLVIRYYNKVLNGDDFNEFYILVQEIFGDIKITKKNTIGDFYRGCTLASREFKFI